MRSTAFGVLMIAAMGFATAPPALGAGCPVVSGTYRPHSGTGAPDADAAKALRLSGIFIGSELRLEGRPEEGLKVWLRVDHGGKFPPMPNFVLQHGTDFTCKDGQLVFNRVQNAKRKTEDAFYEGTSLVRIFPVTNGGLGIDVEFSGGTRSTIYSYDSARVSVPNLGTGKTFRDRLRWPPVSEIESAPPVAAPPEPPEPPEVIKARAMFDHTMLGNAILTTVRASGDFVLVGFRAHNNNEITRIEDRLRAASIRYEMKAPPRWVGQGYYEVDLRVWPTATGAPKASRLSAHRVEQELNRVRFGADVRKVEDVGDGYVATLGIEGTADAEGIVRLFKLNTNNMFADIRLLNDPGRTDSPRTRVIQIKVSER